MTAKKNSHGGELSAALTKLKQISEWFRSQEEIDIEEGLSKVKEAAELIKDSKKRLQSLENEFVEVKKSLTDDNE